MTPTLLAGVVGHPIVHSLSPLLHRAWLEAAELEGAYVPLDIAPERFERFIEGLRGGGVRGLNITSPFKERALALADSADVAAHDAGAANLLLFAPDGRVEARNTDGLGLLAAFAEQAPDLRLHGARVVILGAGGAARSAAAALRNAGAAELRIINRTLDRAETLAAEFGASALDWREAPDALERAGALINATTLGRDGGEPLEISLEGLPRGAAVMDMVYRPLRTPLLEQAASRGLTPVDGLAMLIGQARPSFEAFYGQPPPPVDVRALALEAL